MAYKKLFPAQEDTEKVFLLIRRHWFTYAIFWLLAFLMILPVIVVLVIWIGGFVEISESVGSLIILGGSVYLLGLLALLLFGFVDYYLDVYIVTDRRIVDIRQNGFFRREISELYLQEVQDVNAKVIGFFPTVLHFGEVVIQTAGEVDNFIFSSVPHPYQVSKTIIDLHEKVISGSPEEEKSLSKQKQLSENELSRGRFIGDAVKSAQDFFKEDNARADIEGDDKNKKEDAKEHNNQAEKAEALKIDTNEDIKPKVERKSKETASAQGVLEEGKQVEIQ